MIDYRSSCLTSDKTIKDCIAIIDGSPAKIALIIAEDNTLLGTVTDGDVRRGILQGLSIEDSLTEIMNANPIVAKSSDSDLRIQKTLSAQLLRHMPIIDDQNKLVGLEFLDDIFQHSWTSNLVFLMAGGEGKRLRPLTEDTPKPMLPVGGQPIIETIIKNFRAQGFTNFMISVKYKADQIIEHFGDGKKLDVEIDYIREEKPLGTAGSLHLIEEQITRPFFVMNTDILTNIDFNDVLRYHKQQKAAATICVREHSFKVPYGVVKFDQDYLLKSIEEKPTHTYFANAGIYVLDPAALDYIPKHEEYNMPDLLDRLLDNNLSVAICPIREYWLDIGQHNDFERANIEFNQVFETESA